MIISSMRLLLTNDVGSMKSLVLVVLTSLLLALSVNVSANDCDYENILFSHLAKQYKSTKDCFLIDQRDVSVEGEGVLSVKVRERHNEKCGGDPGTIPSAGIFKVSINSCVIEIYNVAEDEYILLGK